MGIADLLQMLSGQGGGDASPSFASAETPQAGVGGFLGSPDAGMTGQPAQESGMGLQPPPTPTAGLTTPPAGPVTPPSDAGDGGLSGFLSRMVQKATTRNDDTGMNLIDRIGKFGGQMTDMAGDTRGAALGYDAAGQRRVDIAQGNDRAAEIRALSDQLNLSPREKLMFAQNPDEWVKANASRIGFHDIGGGNTGAYGEPGTPGSSTFTAPKVGVEGGEGYSATPNGLTDTGGLAMSPLQQAQAAAKDAQEKSLALYHQLMAQAATKNADAHMVSASKPRATGGASSLPPGY